MLYESKINSRFAAFNCCVIIPTYNNEKTIVKIITDTLAYTDKIIVINDGSTDSTADLLKPFETVITIVHHPINLGKGMALRTAFKKALGIGFRYAITIDSDGQHFPEDFELFLDRILHAPDSLMIGARNMNSENVPGASSFGNKFSNFWFWTETGLKIPDSQSGFRLYPINRMGNIVYFTSGFEFEIEVLVKAAWRGIPIIPVPIQIYYDKIDERVTHFRPGRDSVRISFLNLYLVILAFFWYHPMRFFRGLTPVNIKAFVIEHFFNEKESVLKKSSSVAVGVFFGIFPIWGYQTLSAIAVAYFLKLNKAIVIIAANISFPILLPAILYASLKSGELITGQKSTITFKNINLENIKLNLYVYLSGACILSLVVALFMGALTYFVLRVIRRNKKQQKAENS